MKIRTVYAALAFCLSVAPSVLAQPANPVPITPEEEAVMQKAVTLTHDAASSLHAGRCLQAEKEARQALALGKDSGESEEVLAAALDAQGKDQEALQAYRVMVVDEGAEYPRVLFPYALLLLKSGQSVQAVTIYNQAISQFPEKDPLRVNSHFSPDVPEPAALVVALHIGRGVMYNAGDDWAGEDQHKEMMAEFGKALQLAPDADLANYYYGFGWERLNPKERARIGSIQQAKASLEKAILTGRADVKKAAQKTLRDLNKPADRPANKPANKPA